MHILADGLIPEEITEYTVGMAQLIPNEEIVHGPSLQEDEVQSTESSKYIGENRTTMPGVFFYPADDNVLHFQSMLTCSRISSIFF